MGEQLNENRGKAAQQNIRFFEALLRASADGIVITDAKQNMVMANEAFCNFFGQPCNDVAETSLSVWLDQLDLDAHERWAFIEKQIRSEGICSDVEFQKTTVAGTRYLSVNASVLEQAPSDDTINIISSWRDVTDSIQAEYALQSSEEKLRSTLSSIDDLVFVLDQDGVFCEYYQPSDKPDLYVPPETFLGKSLKDVMPAHTLELFDTAIGKAISSDLVPQVDYYLEMPEEIRWYSAKISKRKDTAGRFAGVTVVSRDITNRKREEEELLHKEEYFRALIENSQDCIVLLDREGKVRYRSPSYESVLGYNPNEDTEDLFDRLHPDNEEMINERLGKLLQTPGAIVSMELQAKHGDGSWIMVEATAHNLIDNSAVGGIVINFRNITERKQAEEALGWELTASEALAELSQAMISQNFSLEDTATIVLESAKRITGSEHGFVASIDPVNKDAVAHTLTQMMGSTCQVEGKDQRIAFPIGDDGKYAKLWGHALNTREAFYTNSPPKHKSSGGLPEGHVPLINFLAVPAIMGDELVGQIALANAKDGYDQEKLTAIKRFADLFAIAVHRKQAEEALKKSEGKYRYLVENINEVVYTIDGEGKISYVSPMVESLLGYSAQEIMGQSFIAFFHPEDISRVKEGFKNLISGISEANEYRLFTKSGELRWIQTSSKPIFVENNVVGLQGLLIDITERKKVEQVLKDNEESLKKAQRIAHVGSWKWNLSSDYFEASEEMKQIYGLDSTDQFDNVWAIMGKIIHLEDKERVFETTRRATLGPVEMSTFRIVRPDGEIRWIEAPSAEIQHQAEDGTPLILVGTVQDITEHKIAQDLILRRNRELSALNVIAQTISESHDLYEIMNNAIDKTLEILSINIGAVYLMDKDTGDLSLKIHRGVTEEDAASVSTITIGTGLLGTAVLSGEPSFIESFADSPELVDNGAGHIVFGQKLKSAMFVPLVAKGNIFGAMGTFTQGERVFASEEKELLITIGNQISTAIANAQLLEEASRAKALEDLDKLRTELLASISHELRTPLTVIRGIADSLVQPDVEWDTETQDDFFRTISEESNVLAHIVNNLIQMSQMEAGMQTLAKTLCSISVIISQLSKQLKDLTPNHQFKLDIQPDLPKLHIDEVRIGEVITNLISNAASYSKNGSHISLQAKQVENEVVVSVTDQGAGISADHIDKIFDRFYRLESGVARRRGGTGLGLSICRGIVEGHGGRIWVESKPGMGSKFSFSLPISENLVS